MSILIGFFIIIGAIGSSDLNHVPMLQTLCYIAVGMLISFNGIRKEVSKR